MKMQDAGVGGAREWGGGEAKEMNQKMHGIR